MPVPSVVSPAVLWTPRLTALAARRANAIWLLSTPREYLPRLFWFSWPSAGTGMTSGPPVREPVSSGRVREPWHKRGRGEWAAGSRVALRAAGWQDSRQAQAAFLKHDLLECARWL